MENLELKKEQSITLEIDGRCLLDCKNVEIRLIQSPTKARMVIFWVRGADNKKCRKSGNNVKILETVNNKDDLAFEKKKFFDWLDSIVSVDCRTDRFYETAWREAQQADAERRSFELSARFTILHIPYTYRLS